MEAAIAAVTAPTATSRRTLHTAAPAALRRLCARRAERRRRETGARGQHTALVRRLGREALRRADLAAEAAKWRGEARAAEALRHAAELALGGLRYRDNEDLRREQERDAALVDTLRRQVIPHFDGLVLEVHGLRNDLRAEIAAAQRERDQAVAAAVELYVRGRGDERAGRPLPDAVHASLAARDPDHPELRLDRARRDERARGRVHALAAARRASALHPNGRAPSSE